MDPVSLKLLDNKNAAAFDALCAQPSLSFRPYTRFREPRVPVEKRRNPGLGLVDDAYNRDWLDRYFAAQAYGSERIGMFECRDALLTDDWGLAIHRPDMTVLSAVRGFGWSDSQLDHVAAQGGALSGRHPDLRFDASVLKREQVKGPAALLSFPGIYTYGHWISDITVRFDLLNAFYDLYEIEHFFAVAPARWMRPFLAAYGIPARKIRPLDKTTLHECADLRIPTIACHHWGGVLPVSLIRPVYRRLRNLINFWGPEPREKSEKAHRLVYLTHTAMTSASGREIANETELKGLVEQLGGVVIDPRSMPLGTLARTLRGTRLVVGQDSSALHNLAFAPADLLVVETERRFNMMHPSIQEACKKRVGFFAADRQEEGSDSASWQVDIPRLDATIRAILAE